MPGRTRSSFFSCRVSFDDSSSSEVCLSERSSLPPLPPSDRRPPSPLNHLLPSRNPSPLDPRPSPAPLVLPPLQPNTPFPLPNARPPRPPPSVDPPTHRGDVRAPPADPAVPQLACVRRSAAACGRRGDDGRGDAVGVVRRERGGWRRWGARGGPEAREKGEGRRAARHGGGLEGQGRHRDADGADRAEEPAAVGGRTVGGPARVGGRGCGREKATYDDDDDEGGPRRDGGA